MDTQTRFIKVSADGADVANDATDWAAVRDVRSGLLWSKEVIAVPNYAGCAAAIEKLQGTAGFGDWRLPTVEELFVLADRTKVSPAIDASFFPDCPCDWFWSSTVDCESPSDSAWIVYFDYGYAYWCSQSDDGFVRAVRVSQ